MSRLGGWLRGSTSKTSINPSPTGSQVDLRAQEIASIEHAMSSAAMIMNDDIDGAEERLRKGDSTFHSLGLGLCTFMRSILGFEKSIMMEASNRLNECENRAWAEMKKAQKESADTRKDRIYPPGSEHALILAEAQLMSAMVAVLHESLTEGIKGFYKLRKAFVTLDGIMESEGAYLKRRGLEPNVSKNKVAPPPPPSATMPGGFGDDDDEDLEFVDADEAHSGAQTPLKYEGHLAKETDIDKKLGDLSLNTDKSSPAPEKGVATTEQPAHAGFADGPDSDIFSDPIDIFIHSGANMCFGVLLLMISLVPPTFSRLLSIIGFKGDRERGIKMLWQSSQFDNINGAVAGLMLLVYYNGLLGFADILPTDEDVEKGAVVGYPRSRCTALLANMRSRYPDSGLWRFEEARNQGNRKDLPGAISILKSNTASKMRQVTALNSFELSLDSMYVGDYTGMRDSFLRCVELNDWSHALYYYLAGCAEIENYRDAYHAETKDEARIQLHRKKADELLRKAPTVAGKKQFMSRPMPFELFVARKVKKWEERSKALGVDLVDAVGVSPTQEMVYLWNGLKKMQAPELEKLGQALSWDRLTASEEARTKIKAETDEHAVREVCRAAIIRALGRFDEARSILEEVLVLDKLAFKGPTKDDYALPAATYEMAVLAWVEGQNPELRKASNTAAEKGSVSSKTTRTGEEAWMRKKLDDCQSWLDKVAKWEAFILDARVGMRVQTGLDTVRWYRREHGWAAV
ncbi:Uu.00g008840.m01.CDS01 [Anthostomella pinea]|uniref:Inclusion body clearance protein IML2 n=1 Tax=Anthostomella pinea TaxID=933095 RepID=A0AAI8VY61_9PEZI|nr:Uu.00g008840.m01.CDS01 [Anthostomella pinea]